MGSRPTSRLRAGGRFRRPAVAASAERRFVEYPRLPFAKRDLAVVVDESRPAGDVLRVIQAAGKNMVAKVTLFDVYRGNPVPEGKKSLACALDLQSSRGHAARGRG